MGYHPRIETIDLASFTTIRCRNSRLWFVNNRKLERQILAYIAKYITKHNVLLYALAIEGNHIQMLADYPDLNRADFMRDLNSVIARLVNRYCEDFEGGGLWERRYSKELVPHHKDDLEDRFFYTVLQPIQDGLVQKLSEYHEYNCFHDAVWGIKRVFKLINWTKYNRARRYNPRVPIKNFEESHTLNYTRLPGFENLTQRQYALIMSKRLEERRVVIVKKRLDSGKGFAGLDALKQTIPGSKPRSTKKSDRYSYRPRVLSVCPLRRAECLEFYFDCYYKFKKASEKLRKGIIDVIFPPGMYKPPFRPPPDLVGVTA
jgi:REP element-mobilizing transposase RayT